jgi:thiamine monophosphate kinase
MTTISTVRDVALIQLDNSDILCTAVDSCGSIGQKPHDVLNVELETVGLFTTRAALLEVLSTGALPVCISVAICNEPETAKCILNGVTHALGEYESIPKVISTEKNMATSMTALGITITGICKKGYLRLGCAKSGDYVFCAGLPLVGQQTLAENALMFELHHLTALFANLRVHTLIPVGSHGIEAEARTLAKESKLCLSLFNDTGLDLEKSAGPASCAVFSAEDSLKDFELDIPVTLIGRLD